jgi:hypothetical protein
MTYGYDEVLLSLYFERTSPVPAQGYLDLSTLLGKVGTLLFDREGLLEALQDLKAVKLVELHPRRHYMWRMAQSFFDDLEGWSQLILEALDNNPVWQDTRDLCDSIRTHKNMGFLDCMMSTLLQYIEDKQPGSLSRRPAGVKLTTNGWIRRCSETQARSS